MIAEQRQLKPEDLRSVLHGDLDQVVLKALEKDRDRRYENPKDLAADIDRYLDDKPVQAVPPSPFYLTRKYMLRHKAAVLTATAILGLLVVATAISTWQAIRANKAEMIADDERDAAVVAKRAALESEAKAAASEARAIAAKNEAEQTSTERRRLLYASKHAARLSTLEQPRGIGKRGSAIVGGLDSNRLERRSSRILVALFVDTLAPKRFAHRLRHKFRGNFFGRKLAYGRPRWN